MRRNYVYKLSFRERLSLFSSVMEWNEWGMFLQYSDIGNNIFSKFLSQFYSIFCLKCATQLHDSCSRGFYAVAGNVIFF